MGPAISLQEEVQNQLEDALQSREKRINSERAEAERKRRARTSFLLASRHCVETVIEPSLRSLESFLQERGQVVSLGMEVSDVGDRLICELKFSGEEAWVALEFLEEPHLRFEFCALKRRARYSRKAKGKGGAATEIHLHALTRALVERELAFAIQSLLE